MRILTAVALLLPLSASALVNTNSVRLAVDVNCELGGVAFSDDDPISVGETKPAAMVVFDFAETNRVGIDALMVYSNYLVFSLDSDCTINGTEYADEDLIYYNPNITSYGMFFDGTMAGLPARVNLDAACFHPGTSNFFISLDVDWRLLNGQWAADEDILYVMGTNIIFDTDGSSDLGIPPRADLDAMSWDGRFLAFSLDVTVVIGISTGRDEDVWIYDSLVSTVKSQPGYLAEGRGDLCALDEPLDSDGDWLTDWEECTGRDEASSTYFGTRIPLDPGARKSDPHLADTDGDGYSDGIEAACGTVPFNSNDYLRITSIHRNGSGAEVTWASAPDRVYDLEATTNAVGGENDILADDYDSDGDFTTFTDHSGHDVYLYRVILVPDP